MISKWLHIDTGVGDPWILPIWAAVNKAEISTPLSQETRELGIYISTRLDILPHIASRINKEVAQLYKIISNYDEKYVFTESQKGYAFPMHEHLELVHFLLTDIDSILFEVNSVCELMTRFFEKLYSHVGIPLGKGKAGLKIKNVIESEGLDSQWFQDLDSHRNFFIHEGAPYLAIDVSHGSTQYDLLIMKENIKFFKDTSKFFKLSELNTIVQGFVAAKPVMQKHLIELF